MLNNGDVAKLSPRCSIGLTIFFILCVLGLSAFLVAAMYLGCAGVWSALWPGFINILPLITNIGLVNSSRVRLGNHDDCNNNNDKNNEISRKKSQCWVEVIFCGIEVAILLTLGLLNIINLTFALFMVINGAMMALSIVLGAYCGNKVEHLGPRITYVSGLVATAVFAFLIAFKVVSLATVVPFVAPSLAFAFLCFLYCVIERCQKGGCCMNLNTGSKSENDDKPYMIEERSPSRYKDQKEESLVQS